MDSKWQSLITNIILSNFYVYMAVQLTILQICILLLICKAVKNNLNPILSQVLQYSNSTQHLVQDVGISIKTSGTSQAEHFLH